MVVHLAELAKAVGIRPAQAWDPIAVTSICEDSRVVRPGALFVAIRGAVHDGGVFVEQAIADGAVGVVSEGDLQLPVPHLRVADARVALAALAATFYERPTEDLFTVGVTGTNGKTTVCHWIAHLLGKESSTIVGTVANAERGLTTLTTPSSLDVQRIAAESRAAGCRNLVLEASSIGIEQHRVDAVDVDAAVFTNLSHDHLDLHGSMDTYLQAKRGLFLGLKPTACAVANADDPLADAVLAGCRARTMTYGLRAGAEVRAIDPVANAKSTQFSLQWRSERVPAMVPHPGPHNLSNALAAACVALERGVSLGEVVDCLPGLPSLPGRFEVFRRADGVIGVVDFAHTPDALEVILRVARLPEGRLLVVFGCPGDGDRGKRRAMGRIAGDLADEAIVTTDNPKHEDSRAIARDIEEGLREVDGRWTCVIDREEAVRGAVAAARPGDTVLLAGKGHETYQIVQDLLVPYSDRLVLEALGFEPESRPDRP